MGCWADVAIYMCTLGMGGGGCPTPSRRKMVSPGLSLLPGWGRGHKEAGLGLELELRRGHLLHFSACKHARKTVSTHKVTESHH